MKVAQAAKYGKVVLVEIFGTVAIVKEVLNKGLNVGVVEKSWQEVGSNRWPAPIIPDAGEADGARQTVETLVNGHLSKTVLPAEGSLEIDLLEDGEEKLVGEGEEGRTCGRDVSGACTARERRTPHHLHHSCALHRPACPCRLLLPSKR